VIANKGILTILHGAIFTLVLKVSLVNLKVALAADVNFNDSLDDAYNRLTDTNVS